MGPRVFGNDKYDPYRGKDECFARGRKDGSVNFAEMKGLNALVLEYMGGAS